MERGEVDINPLVIDVDGTLIKNDLTHDLLALSFKKSPLKILSLFFLGMYDKAKLKDSLVDFVGHNVDVADLPYNEKVIEYGRAHKKAGGEVILCSGSHETIIERIGSHFDWIDESFGTSPSRNLTANNKADFLNEKYPSGFNYIGNSSQDFPVWEAADKAYAISPPKKAIKIKSATGRAVEILEKKESKFIPVMQSLRIHQWAKNGLMWIVPLLTLDRLTHMDIVHLILGFIAFGLLASASYVLNDLLDVSEDRQHRSKHKRPLASGRLSVPTALISIGFIGLLSVVICFFIPSLFMGILAAYLAITLAYSFILKRIVIVDVMTLAGLFTIRVIAGAAIVDEPLSPWLLSFIASFFLSLALIKRYTELRKKDDDDSHLPGRGYLKSDETLVMSFGMNISGIAIVSFILYGLLAENAVLSNDVSVFALCAILIFWLMRVWFLAHRKILNDDPVLFAVKDRVSIFLGFIVGVIVLIEQAKTLW